MANHRGVKDSGEYFVISPISRKVTVPHAHKSIGTVGDHNSEQITFECPRIVDGHDVSQCASRYITWINVNGEIGHDELQIAQVEQGTEGMIYLSWTIRNPLTVAKGVVQFSVHFEDIDEEENTVYRWSTATCRDCDILDSINGVLGAYEAIYVSGETLVFSDYTPVKEGVFHVETDGLIPEGTKRIESNGVYDVGEFAQVDVAVGAHAPQITVQEGGLIIAKEGGVESQEQLSAEHNPNFVAENIKKNVNIFGVEGNYAPIPKISVSDKGLITATADSESVTRQLPVTINGVIYNRTLQGVRVYYTNFNAGSPVEENIVVERDDSKLITCIPNSMIYIVPDTYDYSYEPQTVLNDSQYAVLRLSYGGNVCVRVDSDAFYVEIINKNGSAFG